MTDEVHRVVVQIRPPKGTFPGEVAEGHYVVFENNVILTDADGKPVGSEKRHLNPGDDARLIACRMVRERRRNSTTVNGFSGPIRYGKNYY